MYFSLWVFCVCLCFGMHYFAPFLVLQPSWRGRESWLLCFYCLTDILLLKMSSGFSSWFSGLVWSFWLLYYLIILTNFLVLWPRCRHSQIRLKTHLNLLWNQTTKMPPISYMVLTFKYFWLPGGLVCTFDGRSHSAELLFQALNRHQSRIYIYSSVHESKKNVV